MDTANKEDHKKAQKDYESWLSHTSG